MIYLWLRGRHPLMLIFLVVLYIAIAAHYWRIVLPVTVALLFIAVAIGSRSKARRVAGAHTLADLYRLDPERFEHRVFEILEANGWTRLEWVGGTGDMGADITGWDPLGRCSVVQAKRWRPDATIGSPVIQSLLGARTIYGADHCVLVTTAQFTDQAVQLAAMTDVELVDGVALVGMAQRLEVTA